MPCLKCQNLLLNTKMKNRMKRIECTVFIILSKCKQRLPNPIIEEKRACIIQRCLLFLQAVVSLANELPIVLENS